MSLPASLRNLSLLVGMVAMTCRGSSVRVMGAVPQVASFPTCHPTAPLLPSPPTYLVGLGSLLNSSYPFLNSIFYNFLLICFVFHSLIQSWRAQWKILAFRSWTGVTLNTPNLIGHVTLGKSFNFSELWFSHL